MKQPPPDPTPVESDPPPGYREVWVETDDRRVATEDEHRTRKCRRPGCQRKPLMAVLRSNGWWLYCDWHSYGTRIEDGHALTRKLVPAADELHPDGEERPSEAAMREAEQHFVPVEEPSLFAPGSIEYDPDDGVWRGPA